jgi:hypothetical protein
LPWELSNWKRRKHTLGKWTAVVSVLPYFSTTHTAAERLVASVTHWRAITSPNLDALASCTHAIKKMKPSTKSPEAPREGETKEDFSGVSMLVQR